MLTDFAGALPHSSSVRSCRLRRLPITGWCRSGGATGRWLGWPVTASPARWSTVVGVATGAVTLLGLPLAAVTGQLSAPATDHPGIGKLITAVVILGVVVSWAGTSLWNLASGRLSPTFAALLVNVETVAGFAYVYAARLSWPPLGQLTGLLLVITGVALAVPRQDRAKGGQAGEDGPVAGRAPGFPRRDPGVSNQLMSDDRSERRNTPADVGGQHAGRLLPCPTVMTRGIDFGTTRPRIEPPAARFMGTIWGPHDMHATKHPAGGRPSCQTY